MQIEDRLAILDVQNLYGHVLDRGLWDRLDELFSSDGTFDPSSVGLPAMHGLDEIRAKLIPLEESNPTRCHHSTNVIILSSTSTTAEVLSKYLCTHATGCIAYGEYEDEMVKTAAGWRIKCRRTYRRALGIDDGKSAIFELDENGLIKR